MTTDTPRRLARLLERTGCRIVFAESCTGGLVSALLTKVPGVSSYHCGGVVVYRNATKQAYLDIPPALLKSPGPVSREVTEMLARRVLVKTPEADLAAAVTGHLGPGSPSDLDGVVFAALAVRRGARTAIVASHQWHCPPPAGRVRRQRWVAGEVLGLAARWLEDGLQEST